MKYKNGTNLYFIFSFIFENVDSERCKEAIAFTMIFFICVFKHHFQD